MKKQYSLSSLVDSEIDLSLHCAEMLFCWSCHAAVQISNAMKIQEPEQLSVISLVTTECLVCLRQGPEVINLFFHVQLNSIEHEMSTLIKTKMMKNIDFSCF